MNKQILINVNNYFRKLALRINSQSKLSENEYKQKNQAGFTLIEMLVVVVIVGILSAIAAPSWLAFVSRQRVNKANDALLTTLRDAQQEAKKKKINYSVSFKNRNNVPVVAVYQGSTVPADTDSRWKTLGEDIGFKPGQILIYTNLDSSTTNKKASANLDFTAPTTNSTTITFDYMGTLPDANFATGGGSKDQLGFKVAVAVPQSAGSTTAGKLKRCVIVDTLIGGMRTKKDTECS